MKIETGDIEIGHARHTTIADLSLTPGHLEAQHDGAIPNHKIVIVYKR